MSENISDNKAALNNNSENESQGVTERRPHDRLFKQLFTSFFIEALQLFLPEMLKYLDTNSLVSREQEIFTDLTAGEKYETDILMQGQFNQDVAAEQVGAYFLIHLENQAKSQSDFPKRMFRYFARLYEKHDMPVYPIAVLSYDNPLYAAPSEHKVSFPDQTVLQFNYKVIQLNQLDWKEFVKKPNPVASALMAKMKIKPEDRPLVKATCMAMMFGLHLDEAHSELIKNFVYTYLDLSEAEEQQFEAELNRLIPPSEKEKVMQVLDTWTKRGLEQGKVEGRREGELNMILRQLGRKLGQSLPIEVQEQVSKLSDVQISELGEALLDFDNIQNLVDWLTTAQS